MIFHATEVSGLKVGASNWVFFTLDTGDMPFTYTLRNYFVFSRDYPAEASSYAFNLSRGDSIDWAEGFAKGKTPGPSNTGDPDSNKQLWFPMDNSEWWSFGKKYIAATLAYGGVVVLGDSYEDLGNEWEAVAADARKTGKVNVKPIIKPLPAPMAYKPARDLTAQEALDILGMKAESNGRITLPSKFAGVTFEYCDPKGCRQQAAPNVDPRLGVFLLRLATLLKTNYGTTVIRHAGIWPAGVGQKSHDMGIAIDLWEVETDEGTISVLKDWGNKPKTAGYRLRPSDRGYRIFKDIYEFTSREGDDQQYGPPTVIGETDSFIRHPDLHDVAAAELHKNHMHLQAGQTRTYTGPAVQPGSKGGSTPQTPAAPVSTAGSSSFGALLILGAIAGGAFFLSRQKGGSSVGSKEQHEGQASQSGSDESDDSSQ